MSAKGANVLTAEESEGVRQLYARCVAEKIRVDSVFELALYVIVAKLDVEKALKRMKKYRQIEEEFKLRTIDPEAALWYMTSNCPEFFQPVGKTNEGSTLLAGMYRNFVPSKANDLSLVLKACVMWLQAGVCDLEEARVGTTFVANCEKIGFRNYNYDLERKLSSIYQESFPILIRGMVLVDGPPLLNFLIKLSKPFLKKKFRERIRLLKLKELTALATSDNLPPSFGGTYPGTEAEWFASRRARFLESVAECTCDGVEIIPP